MGIQKVKVDPFWCGVVRRWGAVGVGKRVASSGLRHQFDLGSSFVFHGFQIKQRKRWCGVVVVIVVVEGW
jgi:hypothetical protein